MKKAHAVFGVITLAVMILASVCTANGAIAAQASGTPASACTIDVAVLGKRAALAYRGMPAPVLDGNDYGKEPGQTPRGQG